MTKAYITNIIKTAFQHLSILLVLMGVCVQVHDGDTISVIHENKTIRVRLVSIDSPELGQPYGRSAKNFMTQLCLKENVRVVPLEIDKYRRLVARVYLEDGRELSREMAAHGYAWYYGRYHEDLNIKALQDNARGARLGLWQEPNPTPPWEWRKQNSSSQSSSSPNNNHDILEKQILRLLRGIL